MAKEFNDIKAISNLGVFYKITKNYELAEKYYFLAIEYNDTKALNNLGNNFYF
jgi:TPR repeat protein